MFAIGYASSFAQTEMSRTRMVPAGYLKSLQLNLFEDPSPILNTLRPRQNGRQYAGDIYTENTSDGFGNAQV